MDDIARHLTQLTLDLVKIPSVCGDERLISDWIQAHVVRKAPSAVCYRLGNALIVRPPQDEALPTIGLFGHIDTVKPASEQPTGVIDGCVYGCGASDMKAGLAVMLELLEALSDLRRANLVLVFYDKEEGPILESGLIPVLDSSRLPALDVALCLEPTGNCIEAGCLGGIHARVIVKGRQAHSARPWLGDSAVSRAIPMLSRIAAFGRREVAVGELTYYDVVNVTQASTNNSRNVIPGRFALNVNYRFAPGKTVEEAVAELEGVVLGLEPPVEVPAGVEIFVEDEAPAGADSSGEPILSVWRQANGIELRAKQAWTDVARLTSRGIPAVNFGPGDPQLAHQANEHVRIEQLTRGYHLVRRLFI